MPPELGRERGDLVLNPGEFAHVQDRSKGHVSVYVGPHKASLSDTENTVRWDNDKRRFVPCSSLELAIQPFISVPEGSYVALSNPAKDDKRPKSGSGNPMPDLNFGRKVHLPGPDHFSLWPGETAEVIAGHNLRTNQYLVVRVYNEMEARKNWAQTVIRPQSPSVPTGEAGQGGGTPDQDPKDTAEQQTGVKDQTTTQTPLAQVTGVDSAGLTMGQLIVVKGTEVSFYIPPTGIEVVVDPRTKLYVREAVTLERLEYCILLDENGNKRFVEGPAVVFPKPTETFVEMEGTRKFRAIELNENSGIYVKVIAEYKDGEDTHRVGDELFIKGSEQAIYFPRPEHATIKYGETAIHYAVAVPAGEGRYVLNRLNGEVSLVRGPVMLLPDPRKEVIVQRVLEPSLVELWYPGNAEALRYNQNLMQLTASKAPGDHITSRDADRDFVGSTRLFASAVSEQGYEGLVGETLRRKTSFTPPRTVTLNTKYDGAVSVNVWTGYAILIVSKTGKRRVVVGPDTVLLEYDETLMPMELSTGMPKNDDKPLRTVYLRVLNNKVSDEILVETKDLCRVSVKLSYRVNFTGEDHEKWFSVENYVKFLTDHLRSLIRNIAKQHTIEEFYSDVIDIIRDAVLGAQGGEGAGSGRKGRAFDENKMHVYDVEVLDVSIKDNEIAQLLTTAQRQTMKQTLEIARKEQELAFTKRAESIKQQAAVEAHQTAIKEIELKNKQLDAVHGQQMQVVDAETALYEKRQSAQVASQEALDKVAAADLARKKAEADQQLAAYVSRLTAETDAHGKQMGAITPQLIAALQTLGNQQLASKLAEHLSPIAILRGKSLADVASELLKGTGLDESVAALISRATSPHGNNHGHESRVVHR